MSTVEVFSAGCALCEPTIETVTGSAPGHDVMIRDLSKDKSAVESAVQLGIKAVPAVVVDGQLLSCCTGSGLNEQELMKALA